jgi:uncharacterized membrane protein
MDAAQLVALWSHALAMVLVLGYYVVLGRIALPALSRSLGAADAARAVVAIERRALPLVLIGIVLFVASGIYLLTRDGRYGGVGSFESTWSTLMLVKHLVVVVMVVLGIGIDRIAAALGDATDEGRTRTLGILSLATDGMTALGLIVLLLTAAAQIS